MIAYYTFATAHLTGFSEQEILYMPLARVLSYLHCNLVYNDIPTKWKHADTQTAEKVQGEIKRLLHK